jgi:F-type H+-transporting ATPase subunit b
MAAREVYAIARRALGDLADGDIEEQVGTVFVKRLQEMKKKDLKEIARSVQDGDRRVLVRSGHEVSTKMRQKITRTIHQRIAEGLEVDYETAPDLLLGIELKTLNRKLPWTLKEYLSDLEQSAASLLASAEE